VEALGWKDELVWWEWSEEDDWLKVEELDCVGLGWTGPSCERRAASPRSGSEASSSTPRIRGSSTHVHQYFSIPILSSCFLMDWWKGQG
jgi:hypothetical protein